MRNDPVKAVRHTPCKGVGVFRTAALACVATLIAACQTTGGTASNTIPVTPVCTILCEAVSTATISWNGQVLVSDRTDPATEHGFTEFRPMAGPRGNPGIGFTNPTGVPDTFAISEAWLRRPGRPEVHRAQATPARRAIDNNASGWNIATQDARGLWTQFGFGSANRGDEADNPETAAITVPQLMPVGSANPQMFACAGGRTENGGWRTTWLIESVAPIPNSSTLGHIDPIQDVLSGDDWFVPNAPGPLTGPPTPPTPRISGPGDPIRNGTVQCAMTQLGDDVSTRELHMLAIYNGVLYHSMANDFGPAITASGGTFDRFRHVSGWGDVGQALGGGFGNISAAAIVAHPQAISVFFVAESNFRHRLWHSVRFSASNSWRPVKDVLALSGDSPNGVDHAFRVSAGTCPEFGAAFWDDSNTETVVALIGLHSQIDVMRVVSTPRQWQAGVVGIYSPPRTLATTKLAGPLFLRNVEIVARPFRDDAVPPP